MYWRQSEVHRNVGLKGKPVIGCCNQILVLDPTFFFVTFKTSNREQMFTNEKRSSLLKRLSNNQFFQNLAKDALLVLYLKSGKKGFITH
jgi:hypothetical protein